MIASVFDRTFVLANEVSATGRKITAAEFEEALFSLRFSDNNATPEQALYDLVMRRIYIWEADSLGLLPDIEEVRRLRNENK